MILSFDEPFSNDPKQKKLRKLAHLLFVRKIARTTNVFLLLTVVVINFHYAIWNEPKRVIQWDIISYYAYLPSVFIYDDITLEFADQDRKSFSNKFWYNRVTEDKNLILTSMGLAILYMPFFFIAHLLAPVLGYAADGFTVPYKFALIFSCLFYLAIGLRYLRLFLQRYFSQAVVALTILSVTIGTNLLYYATQDAFWATFLKRRGGNKYWEAIRLPDYDKARKGIYVTVEPEKNQ